MSDSSSDSSFENDDLERLTYDRYRWLKVTFNGQTKRIIDPP